MAPRIIDGPDELQAAVGEELGVSDWLDVDQALIDRFADVTDDRQFIHVDPETAAATPLGGTVAHGLLTLSLGPQFNYQLWEIRGVAFALNYGYDKVRFPAPLPSGSRVRMRAALKSADPVPGGTQVVITQTFEREGGDKPVCVADLVVRAYFG